jgi:hypothetical protein
MYGLAHKRARQQSSNQSGGHDDEESDDDEDQPLNQQQNQSVNQPVEADDSFTLIIVDPADSSNQIVCHSKALRNMIAAFQLAAQILEPEKHAQSNDQSIHQTQTRFHQLLDVNFARCGPSMKACPSPDCHQHVPVQNKICFNCGHAWLMDKPKKKSASQKSRKQHQQNHQSNNQSNYYQSNPHHQSNHRQKRNQTLTGHQPMNPQGYPYDIAGTNGMKFIPQQMHQPMSHMQYQYPPNYSMTVPLPYQQYPPQPNMNPPYQYPQQPQPNNRHRNDQSINRSNHQQTNFYPNQTYPAAYARY